MRRGKLAARRKTALFIGLPVDMGVADKIEVNTQLLPQK